jgi:hypothetical protein
MVLNFKDKVHKHAVSAFERAERAVIVIIDVYTVK